MLTPAEVELILLAVDGETTPEQLDSLRQLLAHSTEATQLYQQLTAQRYLLSQCQVPIPLSLVPRVLDCLPTPRSARGSTERRRDWVPYFSALCLFLAVTTGAFWFTFSGGETGGHRLTSPQAKRAPQAQPTRSFPDRRDDSGSRSVAVAEGQEVAPAPRQSLASVDPTKLADSVGASDVEVAPTPRRPRLDVVASPPATEVLPLASVDLRLPWLVESPDLHKPETVAQLRRELSRFGAFRLDLHGSDLAKAVEVLQSAGQGTSIKFLSESITQDRLHKKQLSSVAIYLDTLTAEEIVTWLTGALRPTGPSTGQPSLFHALHLIPATSQDAADVRLLLGADPGFLKRPQAQTTATTSGSISSGTIDQVTNSLRGSSADMHQAIVVPHTPASARIIPSQSKMIKTYLETRGERRPKSLPILVIIR